MSGATALATHKELVGPTRHLFLSPHYDDVALSCGGTAALLSRAGRAPEVALLFGSAPDPASPLTPFARRMHEGWGLETEAVIAARRAEEARAATLLGTRVAFLPFRDAIYRGDRYPDNEALFGAPAADELPLVQEIAAALPLPTAVDGATRLYAPLAIGGHVDHRLAFLVGLDLARAGWAVWWYEDLPYALRPGATDERLAATGDALEVAAVVDVEDVWAAKLAAILCYPSQLATIFADLTSGAGEAEIEAAMRAHAEAVGRGRAAERFWRLSAKARPSVG